MNVKERVTVIEVDVHDIVCSGSSKYSNENSMNKECMNVIAKIDLASEVNTVNAMVPGLVDAKDVVLMSWISMRQRRSTGAHSSPGETSEYLHVMNGNVMKGGFSINAVDVDANNVDPMKSQVGALGELRMSSVVFRCSGEDAVHEELSSDHCGAGVHIVEEVIQCVGGDDSSSVSGGARVLGSPHAESNGSIGGGACADAHIGFTTGVGIGARVLRSTEGSDNHGEISGPSIYSLQYIYIYTLYISINARISFCFCV